MHSLHAALKDYYTGPNDQQEARVSGYIIDVQRKDNLVEIQTRNFAALRNKLSTLLPSYRLHLVYPIAVEKWIIKLPAEGNDPISRRKSPRKGRLEHAFYELIYIPEIIRHPNLVLEVLLIRMEEIRRTDGAGSWKRKGESIVDRRLLEILDQHIFSSPSDFLTILPPVLPVQFTNQQLAHTLGIPKNLATRMTYTLREMDLIHIVSKRKRSNLYTIGSAEFDE